MKLDSPKLDMDNGNSSAPTRNGTETIGKYFLDKDKLVLSEVNLRRNDVSIQDGAIQLSPPNQSTFYDLESSRTSLLPQGLTFNGDENLLFSQFFQISSTLVLHQKRTTGIFPDVVLSMAGMMVLLYVVFRALVYPIASYKFK